MIISTIRISDISHRDCSFGINGSQTWSTFWSEILRVGSGSVMKLVVETTCSAIFWNLSETSLHGLEFLYEKLNKIADIIIFLTVQK